MQVSFMWLVLGRLLEILDDFLTALLVGGDEGENKAS
jgi:hypothetical protein